MPTQVFAYRAQNKTNERKTEKETIESRRKKVEEAEHDFFSAIYSFIRSFHTLNGTWYEQIKHKCEVPKQVQLKFH
jgi:hypothetical protein